MSTRNVTLYPSGDILIPHAKWCDSFFARMRGFTFTKPIGVGQGLVLVNRRDSQIDSAITMLFVNYDLGVIWVNDAGEVVDSTVARPWRLQYTAKAPAKYVIEGHPSIVDRVRTGDKITFVKE